MEPFLNIPFLNLTEIQDLARFYRETDKKGHVSPRSRGFVIREQ